MIAAIHFSTKYKQEEGEKQLFLPHVHGHSSNVCTRAKGDPLPTPAIPFVRAIYVLLFRKKVGHEGLGLAGKRGRYQSPSPARHNSFR